MTNEEFDALIEKAIGHEAIVAALALEFQTILLNDHTNEETALLIEEKIAEIRKLAEEEQ